MSDASWIVGLMKTAREEVGFIPEPTVQRQYTDKGRYIMQTNERGVNVGYLLHGAPHPGGILVVSQHLIETDKRMRGYGELAFDELVRRAKYANCRAIKLRCAEELSANEFWLHMGFRITRIDNPQNTRHRAINTMLLDLWPTLFDTQSISLNGGLR